MNLLSFLNAFKSTFIDFRVIRFYCDKYPLLFISIFLKFIKSKFSCSVISLSVLDTTVEEIKIRLGTAFLGTPILYVIKDIETLVQSEKKDLIDFLNGYNGQHYIIFFDSNKDYVYEDSCHYIVELSNFLTENEYRSLYSFFFSSFTFNSYFVNHLFKKSKISLENGCMLLYYHLLLGQNTTNFFKNWFEKINSTEILLFNLSQALLEQNSPEFFSLWERQMDFYPIEFWLVYWSELIWESVLFICRVKSSGILEAKRKARKLPFSFMNKTWQNYSSDFLIDAHKYLYKIDYFVKNSVSYYGLELWYHMFLFNLF